MWLVSQAMQHTDLQSSTITPEPGEWAQGPAKAYGVTVEELPSFYAKRTLLNEIILSADIANAYFVFVSGLLTKSSGNVLIVDGGVAMAFVG